MISMNLFEIVKRLKASVVILIAVVLCFVGFSAPVLANASVPNSELIGNSNFLADYMADEDTTEETKQVWEHHIQAWDNSDLEDIMSDYSEDSILILNNTLYKGIDQVACVYDSLFDIFANGNNIIAPETIEGEAIYITWNYTPPNDHAYDGTDTFVVRNGIIEYQTIASRLYEQYPISCQIEAEIDFTKDYQEIVKGELVPGGKFKVTYDSDRLTCARGYKYGQPAWSILGYVQYVKDGESSYQPLMTPGKDVILTSVYEIPSDAEEVIMYFYNNDGLHEPCYDSDYSANYHFPLTK